MRRVIACAFVLLLCMLPAVVWAETLARGDQGDVVLAAQQRMSVLGFLSGEADGIFGAQTEQAVRAFQSYLLALQAEGLYQPDPVSIDGQLTEAQRCYLSDPLLPLEYASFVHGDRGDGVLRLQIRLSTLGYLDEEDGIYGDNTREALRYFQKTCGLAQTGIADATTQQALFSESAPYTDQPVYPYLLKISLSDQRVYAFEWTESGYTHRIRSMVCSTGLDSTPTPTGTYRASGPVSRWCYFPKFGFWAQYGYRIRGNILFHSVLYVRANESSLKQSSLDNLGSKASNGCVRLTVENARWIYENCPAGTTVIIY